MSSSASFETVPSLWSFFFMPEDEDALLGWVEKVLANKAHMLACWRLKSLSEDTTTHNKYMHLYH